MRKKIALLLVTMIALVTPTTFASSQAPAKLQGALIIKLLPYYTNLGKEFKIHVIGAPDVAAVLKASVGSKTGKAKLVGVTAGDDIPSEKVDVVYIGKNAPAGTNWAQSNGALSITGNPQLIEAGVTLGIGLENNKPKIYLNLKSSKAEGVDWNPAILKVAKTVG